MPVLTAKPAIPKSSAPTRNQTKTIIHLVKIEKPGLDKEPFMPSKDNFEEELRDLRRDKDSFFRADIDSPIPPDKRPTFRGLNYYPPDKAFRVQARLTRFDSPEPLKVDTSTGEPQTYLKYGKIEFEIQGSRMQLFVYKSAENPFAMSLFLPFRDTTSGSETYGSGRYLDLEEQGGDEYQLDFNKAYNPYCAYDGSYTCPIPPRENILPVRIVAGEKNYK
jgi:hypothetical protein